MVISQSDININRRRRRNGNHPRCHDCGHIRGPRSTSNMAQADNGTKEHPARAHGIQPKKASCNCTCHLEVD